MRLAPLAVASVVTAVCAATVLPRLPLAAAGDDRPDAPLAAADRHEAEGRALLERGEKVAAAKHMIEAWSLRARAWASEGRRETPAEADRLAALRAKSAAAEQEAHALRAAGKIEEADARIQDATRLWKEAEAVEAALRRRQAEERASAAGLERKGADAAVALERKRALEAKAKALEAEAADLWAAGKIDEAEARLVKAKAVRAAAAEAAPAPKAKGDDARPELKVKTEARRGAEGELVGEVRRLRQQVDELRAALEELRARLPAPAATPAK